MEMQMVGKEGKDPLVVLQALAALAQVKQEALRIRLPLAVLNHESKQYIPLPRVSWLMDITTVEGVQNLRKVLDLLFSLMQTMGGPTPMLAYLQEVEQLVVRPALDPTTPVEVPLG